MADAQLDPKERRRATTTVASRRWRAKNREKSLAAGRRWYAENRAQQRDRVRSNSWKRNGRPEPTRPRPDACEACGNSQPEKVLALDHCHVTGRFRGWLCSNCNRGLGLIGDHKNSVEKMLDYLNRVTTE